MCVRGKSTKRRKDNTKMLLLPCPCAELIFKSTFIDFGSEIFVFRTWQHIRRPKSICKCFAMRPAVRSRSCSLQKEKILNISMPL